MFVPCSINGQLDLEQGLVIRSLFDIMYYWILVFQGGMGAALLKKPDTVKQVTSYNLIS